MKFFLGRSSTSSDADSAFICSACCPVSPDGTTASASPSSRSTTRNSPPSSYSSAALRSLLIRPRAFSSPLAARVASNIAAVSRARRRAIAFETARSRSGESSRTSSHLSGELAHIHATSSQTTRQSDFPLWEDSPQESGLDAWLPPPSSATSP